jgi:hypothetical protein
LPHKRDGPVSQATTAGPQETRPDSFLPLPELPRKAFPPPAPDPSPKPTTIRRRQRRQDTRWRGFAVRLYAEPGVDGTRALRALLKVALRRFGLRAIDAREIDENLS